MRIYFVLESLGGHGGVEIALTSVIKILKQHGHETYVFLPGQSLDPEWEKYLDHVYYYHQNQREGVSETEFIGDRAIGLAETFSQFDVPPDLVVATHVPFTVLYAKLAIGNNRIPLVSWLHNPPNLFRNYHYINYADIHWCISRGIEDFLKVNLHNNHHVHWVGNPFDLQSQKLSHSKKPHFVYMGRIDNRQKRLDLLLLSFQQLAAEWTLDIYGTGKDEELLKQLAVALGISDKVVWHEWVENPWDLIQEATALVLTSDFEGLPMVIGEAMARGLPVISTNCPTGPADYIENGVNGWLIPTGDQETLVKALAHVSDLLAEEWERVSRAAVLKMDQYSDAAVYRRMMDAIADFVPESGVDQNDH